MKDLGFWSELSIYVYSLMSGLVQVLDLGMIYVKVYRKLTLPYGTIDFLYF